MAIEVSKAQEAGLRPLKIDSTTEHNLNLLKSLTKKIVKKNGAKTIAEVEIIEPKIPADLNPT